MFLPPITTFGASAKLLGLLLAFLLVVGSVFYHIISVARLETKLSDARMRTAHSEAREASLRTALDTAAVVNEKFDHTVTAQNKQILSLQTAAAAREKAVTDALLELRRVHREQDEKYGPIITGQPAIASDLCKSLDQRLHQYLEARLAEVRQ
jgi:hypothetical protein